MELVVVPNDVIEASADVEEEFLKTSSGLWVRVSLMELVGFDISSIVREASAECEEKLLQLLVAITIALG